MVGKIVKVAIAAVVAVALLIVGGIGTLIYLRTGQQYYDPKNLEACTHYTNEQAKEAVLTAWLKHWGGFKSWEEAQQAATEHGVSFIDSEIQGPAKLWLVPFTSTDKPGKKQFGMLDCGTLTVEFASE